MEPSDNFSSQYTAGQLRALGSSIQHTGIFDGWFQEIGTGPVLDQAWPVSPTRWLGSMPMVSKAP